MPSQRCFPRSPTTGKKMAEQTGTPLIESRLRVLTWNVWWRYGPWQERAPAIAATLTTLDADIIALQEVWGDGGTDFAAELAAKLGYQHVYAPAKDMDGIYQGNALLSRWPIVHHEILQLYSEPERDEHRVAIHAEIDGPRGALPVFCTHLNWMQQHSHIRQRQVADLARLVDKKHATGYPPIICGDFNADPQSEEIRMMTGQTTCPVEGMVFHDAWAFAGDGGPGYTWSNTNPFAAATLEPNRRIDYIFTGWPGKRGAGHIVSCQVTGNTPVDGIWPSDHLALMAELRY